MKLNKFFSAYVHGNNLDKISIRTKIEGRLLGDNQWQNVNFSYRKLIDFSYLDDTYVKSIDSQIFTHYLQHEFNFLGTGWTNWNITIENKKGDYRKIAWRKDIKSDYSFDQTHIGSDTIENLPNGIDIKIPWELARMQHWPQMALYGVKHDEKQKCILREFENQLNDFMECNPVGAGIHFYCAMEIAIRAINLLISYDIISQYKKATFSDKFEKQFLSYLYAHVHGIILRLEKNYITGHTGNHYLTDLCGLLWLSMYFESPPLQNIRSAICEEFITEYFKQFNDDGSNYECSTGYHMLSSEIAGLSLFAINKLEPSILSFRVWQRLYKIRSVIDIFEARNGRIIQIGDNDSGRILKLYPNYYGNKENCLDPQEIKNLLDYLLKQKRENNYADLLSAFRNNNFPITDSDSTTSNKATGEITDGDTMVFLGKELNQKNWEVKAALGSIRALYYLSDFGLVKIVCENADIFIRTVPKYYLMDVSHAHDDVFSFEIVFQDGRIGEDLGSVVYTSDKERRRLFSSSAAHDVPIHSIPILNRVGTFTAETEAIGKTMMQENTVKVEASWQGIIHIRKFKIENNTIKITDICNQPFQVQSPQDKYFSLGYGQLYEAKHESC